MPRINTSVIMHKLNLDPKAHPVKQKRHVFNPKRYAAISEEVEKMKSFGAIQEVHYPEWIANVVMVKKKMGSGGCVLTSLT